jgi:glycosyltransferase involved in cell wall biosynthesis
LELEARAITLFPALKGTFQVLRSEAELQALPACDVAVATQWAGAYSLMRFPRAGMGAYFVQDYEPLFYPAGTHYGLAEQTYRMGLYGIFNTQGLHDFVTGQYPMKGTWFEPTVDRHIFNAARPTREGAVRIFFYARPSTDRNGFELGLAALTRLKAMFGAKIEIVTAGEPWNPADYGAGNVLQNLGVLTYEQTGDLYRSCDVGLCFMFTKHPSYLPLEMMACGVTVVTNDNPTNHWLFEHGQNALLAAPVVSSVVEQLRRAITDDELRRRISQTAAERMVHTTWEDQVDRVYESLVQVRSRRLAS